MTIPTGIDVQPVDPVLTNMLIGYMQAEDRFIADRLFPSVSVEKDSGTYTTFTKKYWFSDAMARRAYGEQYARSGYGVGSSTYTTLQWALAMPIADEVRANSQVPMDLESAAVSWLAQKNLIRKERGLAADFFTTSVWGTDDNNSATDWDDFAAGDPVSNVNTAVRTISNATGQKANTLACGFIVDDALRNHPDIIDRLKYVQAATVQNVAGAMASLFGLVNYWPAIGSYNSANEGQSGTYAAIIDDDALVCYVDPGAGIFGASAGKTFVWGPGGGSGSIMPVERDGNSDADLVKMKAQWDQVATATDLGYFFADIV